MFYNEYPYTDFHELNLDWILKRILELSETVRNFVNLESIKYADPIQWNITKNYAKNTIVQDDGLTYLSKQPVPPGVPLSNTSYWLKVADFDSEAERIRGEIAEANDGSDPVSSADRSAGSLVWLNDQLYEVITEIHTGDTYVFSGLNANVAHVTVEELIAREVSARIALENRYDALELNTQTVSVELYGAVGDGTTDDTAAIQAALDDKKNITLTAGKTYRITNTITMNPGNTFSGPGKILIDFTTPYNAIELGGYNVVSGISFEDTGTVYDNVGSVISGIEKDNNKVVWCDFTDIHLGYCIRIEHASNNEVCYNFIDGYSYAGIVFAYTCTYITVEHNSVNDGRWIGNNNRYPICVSSYGTPDTNHGPASLIKCNYNKILDTSPLWEGIDSHGCVNAEFIGNYIVGTVTGIVLTVPTSAGPLSANCENIIIENNLIIHDEAPWSSYAKSGIIVQTDTDANNIRIANNHTELRTDTSITSVSVTTTEIAVYSAEDMSNVIIEGNTVKQKGSCIALSCAAGKAKTVRVSDNNLSGCDLGTNSIAININELRNFANVEIANNNIDISATAYSLRGYTANPQKELVNYRGNVDNARYNAYDFTTVPRNTFTDTANGKPGDFVPCSDGSGSTVGWFCISQGVWKAVSGT